MKLSRIKSVFFCFSFMISTILLSGRSEKPNIVLIMADDIGAESIGAYGSTIFSTPQLDQMAKEGIRFENTYATPICTPSRVMIMSGQYPNKTGFDTLIDDKGEELPDTLKTIGHYFKDAGYNTGVAGKWQLARFDHHPDHPTRLGFDEYCLWKWMWSEGGVIYKNKKEKRKHKTSRYWKPAIWKNGESIDGDKSMFGPDVYTQFCLDFIDKNKEESFFLYFPMTLPHSPFIVPPALKDLAYSKYPEGLSKAELNFGHMVTYMDMLVGKILKKLKDCGLSENTLVIFTADNGTHKLITSKVGDLDIVGGKGNMNESGTRVPFIAWWPGQIEKNVVCEEFFSLVDVVPTLSSWAGYKLAPEVDGKNLSHLFYRKEGENRDHVLSIYKKQFFIRNKEHRLHQDSSFFHIPINSDKKRYSEKEVSTGEFLERRQNLQNMLDEYMQVGSSEYLNELKSFLSK